MSERDELRDRKKKAIESLLLQEMGDWEIGDMNAAEIAASVASLLADALVDGKI